MISRLTTSVIKVIRCGQNLIPDVIHDLIETLYILWNKFMYYIDIYSRRTRSRANGPMCETYWWANRPWANGRMRTRRGGERTFYLQYGLRVPFWNQKLHFRFTCFYLLALLNGSFKTFFLSLKNINLII